MPSPREPCRVLVVDDCPDTRDSFAALLRMWGHDVRTAGDGPTALTIASEYRPQVVLLDIGLPGLDGWEVGRRLRGLVRTVLIGVSGFGQSADRERARREGWDYYFVKPVEPEQLQRLLDTVAAACRPMPAAERRTRPGAHHGLIELATILQGEWLARRAEELRLRGDAQCARSASLALRLKAAMLLVEHWLRTHAPKPRD